jgi:hypothetical protein
MVQGMMTEFKIENVSLPKNFGDEAENSFLSAGWIPSYDEYTDMTFEETQSVPDLAAAPFLGQPNYSTISSAPGWMTENFQNGGNFNVSAGIGDAYLGHGENPLLSPAPSTSSSFAFSESEEKAERDEKFDKFVSALGITERDLQRFSVKELNRFLKSNGLSKEQQQRIKNRRRTLKNRGYAQNCRVKRINNKKSLEFQNEELHKELDHLKADLEKVKRDRDLYKAKLVQVVKFLKEKRKRRLEV